MLQDYLRSEGCAAGDDGCYGFGDDRAAAIPSSVNRESSQKQPIALRRLSFPDWTSRVSIASPAEKAVTPLLEDKVRFGIYVHDLLAGIEHASDVEEVVECFAKENNLDDNEIDMLGGLARKVVAHPDTARFFADGCHVANEASFLDGGVLGRPDRVVFADGETWVVDFKTGTPMPQHTVQVRSYCGAVSRMGYPNVAGYLIYIHEGEVSVVECK